MNKYKKISYILIAVVILGIFLSVPLDTKGQATSPAGSAYSGSPTTGWQPTSGATGGKCSIFTWDGLKWCAFELGYIVIWKPAYLFMYIGGLALDKSIDLSIIKSPLAYLTQSSDSAVTAGWSLARDIVNLFLIFIVLYIAIATILQIPGYGAKELLATLIIVAFLVNFSLVITKMIIDASNILAMGFYNSFPKSADGGVAISQVFKEALSVEKVAADENAIKSPDGAVLMLAVLFGAAIAAIAGFIFLVFAVLFFIRMVSLMILMVFAPLAFAAHILPSTNKHAHKWWDYLFSQAFFAPAALFMLWLSAKIAKSGFIENALGVKTPTKGYGDMITALADPNAQNRGDIVIFTVQYIIIAIILCFSLILAKQMGAMGAESVQKGAAKAGKKLQGYAGRIGRRYTAGAAERIATGEGAFAKTIRAIPFATRGLARVSAGAKGEVADYEKKYDSSSSGTLKNLSGQFGTNRNAQIAILKILTKRKDLDQFKSPSDQKLLMSIKERAQAVGYSMTDVVRQRPDTARTPEEIKYTIEKIRPADIQDFDDWIVKGLPDKNKFFEGAAYNWSPGHVQEIVKKGGEAQKEYVEALKRLAGGSENVADIAEALAKQNASTARWLEAEAGTTLLGLKASKKTPPSAPAPAIEAATSAGGGKRTPGQQRRMEELREETTPSSRPPLAPPTEMPPPPKPEV